MLRLRRAQPRLESLEGRYAPATIRLIGGNLYISNNTGDLTVTATANNTFSVTDGLKTVAGLKAGAGVFITSSNKIETVTFDIAGNLFTGNLLINSRNGSDTVNINSTGGTIRGNVTLLTGLGNDTVTTPQLGGDLRVGGSMTIADPAGLDTLNMFNGGGVDSLGGNLTVTGYNAVTIGGGTDLIGGSINLSTPNDGQNLTLVVADGLAVGRNMSVRAGGQNDSFNLGAVTINGNLLVDFGGGAQNDFDLSTGAGGGIVGGNVYLASSAAAGAVTNNSGPLAVGGNMTLNFGDGDYIFALGVGGLVDVGGNFSLTAGNGNNAGGLLLGNIGGNVNLRFGNGDNDFTVLTAPGGTVNWASGNGTNTLTLGSGGAGGNFNVNAVFGSGDDTLVLDTGATDQLTGFIDFDGDSGAGDTLTVNSGILSPTLVILGLP